MRNQRRRPRTRFRPVRRGLRRAPCRRSPRRSQGSQQGSHARRCRLRGRRALRRSKERIVIPCRVRWLRVTRRAARLRGRSAEYLRKTTFARSRSGHARRGKSPRAALHRRRHGSHRLFRVASCRRRCWARAADKELGKLPRRARWFWTRLRRRLHRCSAQPRLRLRGRSRRSRRHRRRGRRSRLCLQALKQLRELPRRLLRSGGLRLLHRRPKQRIRRCRFGLRRLSERAQKHPRRAKRLARTVRSRFRFVIRHETSFPGALGLTAKLTRSRIARKARRATSKPGPPHPTNFSLTFCALRYALSV